MSKAETTEWTGGTAISQILQAYGVTHIFFLDAMLRSAQRDMYDVGIKRILAHSEMSAAYMADGYARVSRRAGVCLAQSVGAANLAAGLQDAFLGQSSVLAITGRQTATRLHRNAYQELSHQHLFTDVTKFSTTVEAPGQLAFLMQRALQEAIAGTPGPTHLDMPNHLGEEAETWAMPGFRPIEPRTIMVPAFRPHAARDVVAEAVAAIGRSARPAIVAGVGAIQSGAEQAITALADKIGAVFVGAADAKAVMVEQHPLNAGACGTYSRPCANQLLSEADLVLFCGSDTGDQVTNMWRIPRPGAVIIQIDPDAHEIGRNYPDCIGLQADIRSGVEQLTAEVKQSERRSWRDRIATVVGEWRREVEPFRQSSARPIRPERLCRDLGEFLPRDAIVVADTGYSALWTATHLDLKWPGQNYYRAAGSLGWAFPASLGAKCAAPDRPVFCFTGDGGFLYHLSELETARRTGIKTVTIVNNNSRLLQGGRTIDKIYGNHPGRTDLYHLRDTDYAAIAEEFGCLGLRVEAPDELLPALKTALASDLPALVDVVSDPGAHTPAPWAPSN